MVSPEIKLDSYRGYFERGEMNLQINIVPLTITSRSGHIGPLWRRGEIDGMVRGAARIWQQANIQIQMRGVTERSLNMPSAISGMTMQALPGLPRQLSIRGGGVIVALVHNISGNFHAGLAVRGGRICILQWPCAGGARVPHLTNDLAHELGHIMGLDDYNDNVRISQQVPSDIQGQIAARNNLMASSRVQGTLLTQDQINTVRRSPWVR